MSVSDEDYPRRASCALNIIATFSLSNIPSINKDVGVVSVFIPSINKDVGLSQYLVKCLVQVSVNVIMSSVVNVIEQ